MIDSVANDKKHILFIFRSMGTGGAQKVQSFVANLCISSGYEVSIITMSRDKDTVGISSQIPISIVEYDTNKTNALYKLHYLSKMRKEILRFKPDLIVSFLIDVVRITVLATKGLNIPILASERGDPTSFSTKKLIQYSKSLNKCREVVFQLASAREAYTLHPNLATSIIANPCISRSGRDFSIPGQTNGKIILSAGRLSKQKRFDILIRAFTLVKQSHPDYRLIIYGEGEEKNALETLVRDLDLDSSVEMLGEIDDVFGENNKAEIFALSSDYEGIPNVLIEAMGSGIPCVSTDCSPGGARLLLDNGRRGLLVDKGDWRALGNAINTVIEDSTVRETIVKNGFEIFDLYTPTLISGQWMDVIIRCLN